MCRSCRPAAAEVGSCGTLASRHVQPPCVAALHLMRPASLINPCMLLRVQHSPAVPLELDQRRLRPKPPPPPPPLSSCDLRLPAATAVEKCILRRQVASGVKLPPASSCLRRQLGALCY